MKILIVAPQPFYAERGTPIAVRLLAETLCDFGHQVDLLAYHEGTTIQYPSLRLLRAGRPPFIQSVPIGISWQKLVCDIWLIASMLRLMLRSRYDVIHTVEEAIFPASVLSRLVGCKLVYDMDSWMSQQVLDKWTALRPARELLVGIERAAVRRADVVLPVCEDLAMIVRQWLDPGRVVVLPDVPLESGVSSEPVESLVAERRPGEVVALYVGNLESYQGIDLMLAGIMLLPADLSLTTIVVGGSQQDVDHYRQEIQALGLAGRVHFVGARPLQHLMAYLNQADILLSPRTLGQNTPMKIYSYMQAGKPILATRIRSHTQVLDDGCAELVDPQPAPFADGLGRLAQNEVRRKELGRAAKTIAERDYSLDAYRGRLRRAYRLLEPAG